MLQEPLRAAPRRRFSNYAPDWESFLERSLQLAEADPFRTRLVVKYSPSKNTCWLKVTDGKTIVMRKTKSLEDFEKIQQTVQLMASLLSNRKDWVKEQPQKEREKDKEKEKKKKRKKGK